MRKSISILRDGVAMCFAERWEKPFSNGDPSVQIMKYEHKREVLVLKYKWCINVDSTKPEA